MAWLLRIIVYCQYEYRHIAAARSKSFQHLAPIQFRQREVENDQCIRLRYEEMVGVRSVVDAIDRIPALAQRPRQPLGQRLIVFNQ
jgi:hypothetical protein